METLAPSLHLLIYVRFSLESGESLRKTLQDYETLENHPEWTPFLRRWMTARQLGQDITPLIKSLKTPSQRALIQLLNQGLGGESIHPVLVQLEEELLEQANDEIEEFVSTLPLKALMPLLLFQFPAYLILMLAPLLISLISAS